MPKEILSRCGNRCDLCLAYKDNIEKNDQRIFLSDTWFKIYGFRIPANEIFCEGCLSSDESGTKIIDKECPVRPCVIDKGLENCSQCSDLPCEKFIQRMVIYENLLKDKNITISRKEYIACIKPYENKKRLDVIQSRNGRFSRLYNSEIKPTGESILKFIGKNKPVTAWLKLIEFMDDNYSLDCNILFGGKNYGWAVQYKKGKKTIVTFFPERKAFTVLLTFGGEELNKINEHHNILSPGVMKLISETRQLHDGKWIWIRLEDEVLTGDIVDLIKIKRIPDKKRQVDSPA